MEASGLETNFARLREEMVSTQLISRGIRDLRVLEAMRRVPRHLFVPEELRHRAYEDGPLPIGHGQTISQPYIVAFMTECLELKGEGRVLEVGTGSGYQTAVLAELASEVATLEIHEDLSSEARERLHGLGYANVLAEARDGRAGWPERAPFDGILAAASAEEVPPRWLEQLAAGGRLILPLGQHRQDLWIYSQGSERAVPRRLLPVRFVPLVHG